MTDRMGRCWFCFLFVLLSSISALSSELTVREAGIDFGAKQITVSLPLVEPANQAQQISLSLKLLDPDNLVRASSLTKVTLRKGQREITGAIVDPLHDIPRNDQSEFVWYRVAYEIRAESSRLLSSGLVPVSAAKSGLFRLAIAAGKYARAVRLYQVEVNAANPITQKPVRGVVVKGELAWDDDDSENNETKLTAQGITDAIGGVRLDFKLPGKINSDEGELRIAGVKGIISRVVEKDIDFSRGKVILLDTDKPIYQPGQTLHLRTLLFDSQRKVVPSTELVAIIRDEETTSLFHQSMVTDNFGVAHADWVIPSNLRLGTYAIQVRQQHADDADPESTFQSVRIYRYDLPNFSVTAQPDHPYYLPEQNAFVKVSANYLFGRPVVRAKVRVVEEEERHWNYRAQKWDFDEGQTVTGEAGQDGDFTAKLDLSSHHDDLADSSYKRSQDVDYSAYVTDLTTGRTEQRRFRLRLTRQPIHVYVQSPDFSESGASDVYISAFYADGTPARCTLRLSAVKEDSPETSRQFLRSVKTNKYGLAKVRSLLISEKDFDRESLLVEAEDPKGLKGSHIETFWSRDRDRIIVSTSHTIYKPDESFEVSLEGSQPTMQLLVNVLHDNEVIAAQHVALRRGRGFVTFPYDPRFTGRVAITALSLSTMKNRYDYPSGSRVVLFPKNRRLNLRVRFDRNSYRPGQRGSADFAVRGPNGSTVESVLGVKIVDQSVEERARTDQEFGTDNSSRRYWDSWEGDESFAGISTEDLDNLDLTQPVPEDLDLVAEVMMSSTWGGEIQEVEMDDEIESGENVFHNYLANQFVPLQKTVGSNVSSGLSVKDLDDLVKVGQSADIDVLKLPDPWGTPYHYQFSYEYTNEVVTISSAGPDKRFGDGDDFDAYSLRWQYFQYVGSAIDMVCHDFFLRNGRFLRDGQTLRSELLNRGIDFDSQRDPWGHPYETRFTVEGTFFVMRVMSPGPHPTRTAPSTKNGLEIWSNRTDYFPAVRKQIDDVLNKHLQSGGVLPDGEEAFRKILRLGGVDLDSMQDPWGRTYYVVFKSAPEYSQKIVVKSLSGSEDRSSVPVTVVHRDLSVMSPGLDGIPYTVDDFAVAHYSALVSEQRGIDIAPKLTPPAPALTGNTGAIRGVVIDETGAAIAGASVAAVREGSETEYKETSNWEGKFILLHLAPGLYNLHVNATGFKESHLLAVPVNSATLTELSVVLRVGATTEMVTVEATAGRVETSTSAVASVASLPVLRSPEKSSTVSQSRPLSTPRLREYFPETMLWEPSLVTNRSGRATLPFKLADNITTWKLSALASTKTGELGRVEIDLRSFQPFFVEHDPPRVLTEGDEIAYPVVLRNYLDKSQMVQATIKPETWFRLLGPAEQAVHLDPGDSASAVFRYRAMASVEGGKQRISAANTEISDAIEKPLDVHPLGRPESQSDSTLFESSATLHVKVPQDAVPGSLRGQLKIYPSLLAHVTESIEAILERPYGCGEQTISSTYPSLLLVKVYKERGGDAPPVAARAQRYLQAGYERLLRYQDASGGFTYWGHGDADAALTAYALEFLTNASQLITVDESVVENAARWLRSTQRKDGSWEQRWQDTNGAIVQTAYIARVLAEVPKEKGPIDKPDTSLKLALQFLAAYRSSMLEPYAIASYALAAQAAGEKSTADSLLDALRSTAHREGEAAFWDLQTNTPFYSWGRTGRLESTALVVRALGQASPKESRPAVDQESIRRGVLFLLRNQDRYGIWYSGQTTVNVLQTLLALLSEAKSGSATLHISVNGKDVIPLNLPPGNEAAALMLVDLKPFIQSGDNQVELRTDGNASALSVQAVIYYYTPWPTGNTSDSVRPDDNSSLKLQVTYSKTQAAENDTIECQVKAERIGFRGYGMMLAEIGLPPGVDVNRESLEAATSEDWAVSHYDVMPDHVVVYLWPQAGGTRFKFKFRLRFGMNAQTAPSLLYDYYNPDAFVILKPVKFAVSEKSLASN